MGRTRRKLGTKAGAELARKIRELRRRLALQQGPFGRLIGVSQQTVSDWERGKRLSQIEVAIRLLRLLDNPAASKSWGPGE